MTEPELRASASRYDARIRDFQRGLRLTALVAIPATVLIAGVLGDWTPRELGFIALVAVLISVAMLPLAHAVDRRYLRQVRDKVHGAVVGALERRRQLLISRDGSAIQIVLNFIFAYAIGAVVAVAIGNMLAGLPLWTNLVPAFIAGLTGGALVDGALNYFNGEALIAELIAILSAVRGEFAPVSQSARGGIGRHFLVVMIVVIAVSIIALGGGGWHLLLQLNAGTLAPAGAPCERALLTLRRRWSWHCSSRCLASRILARSIARPILHTVELMDRLRDGDVLPAEALHGEPRFSHEAGLLVAAFADANIGLHRLAQSGEALAGGDLAVKIDPNSERDIVAIAFRHVVDVIREVVGNVRRTAEMLETSATAPFRVAQMSLLRTPAPTSTISPGWRRRCRPSTPRSSASLREPENSRRSQPARGIRPNDWARRRKPTRRVSINSRIPPRQPSMRPTTMSQKFLRRRSGESADAASAAIPSRRSYCSEEAAGVMEELVKTIETFCG